MKATIIFAFLVLLSTSIGEAQTILFDTAGGPASSGGNTLSDNFWPSHRFQVTGITFVVQQVGGVFSTTSSLDVFGAIVRLSGPTDLPDTADLSSNDVLATTILHLQGGVNVTEAPLPLTLSPGWYSLVFGTGKFGASMNPNLFVSLMPGHSLDGDPTQLTISIHQNDGSFIPQSSHGRFFATGIPIPEPSSLLLAAMAAVGVMVRVPK